MRHGPAVSRLCETCAAEADQGTVGGADRSFLIDQGEALLLAELPKREFSQVTASAGSSYMEQKAG
jgi:hypothetical protein